MAFSISDFSSFDNLSANFSPNDLISLKLVNYEVKFKELFNILLSLIYCIFSFKQGLKFSPKKGNSLTINTPISS